VAALLLMLLHWPDLALRYPQPSRLERVQRSGTLRVAVPVDPGIDHAAFQDMHHVLLREFANRLDVTVDLFEADSQVELLDMLTRDEVDIAVPGQPLPDPLPRHLRAAPTYAETQTHVVCKGAAGLSLDLQSGTALRHIRVSDSDGYVARLSRAGLVRIGLAPTSPLGTVALLERVSAGGIPCTLAQQDEVERARQRLPALRLGAAIGPPGSIGWVLRNTRDDSLSRQVDRFFVNSRKSGLLAQLRQQEQGLRDRFDVVDLEGFRLALATKLPHFEADFRRAGAEQGIDWRLLAALAYQESRWNPRAESPRGASGLMMLTADTARSMGGGSRLDAGASIVAGARYLAQLRADVGDSVAEPDRTWLTLAAYNVGPGGLARARQAVRERGGDPDRWPEVRQALPSLGRGARGWEPVYHVESVLRYFALLSAHGAPDQQSLHGFNRRAGPAASVDADARSAPGRTRHRSETG
jgi:membrane-bound lytic murein transglycosylase F